MMRLPQSAKEEIEQVKAFYIKQRNEQNNILDRLYGNVDKRTRRDIELTTDRIMRYEQRIAELQELS